MVNIARPNDGQNVVEPDGWAFIILAFKDQTQPRDAQRFEKVAREGVQKLIEINRFQHGQHGIVDQVGAAEVLISAACSLIMGPRFKRNVF